MSTIDKSIVEKIIEAGTMAPSGENCQPWEFIVESNTIKIFNLPDRDNSLYSWGQRASFVAHGALVENMNIAARALGYVLKVELFPDEKASNIVARVHLEQGVRVEEPLYKFIYERKTNRKPYQKFILTDSQRQALQQTENEEFPLQLLLVTNDQKKEQLAQAASMNERILFENKSLHSFFFDHINWNKEQDKKNKIGFYLPTLELPPPARVGFKLFRHWHVAQLLNTLGVSKFVAKENSKVYASSSAFGAIVMDDSMSEQFFYAGRRMQRVWLTATKMGFSVQPLTGVLFLMLKIRAGDVDYLSPSHIELVKKTYQCIESAFGISSGTIGMMFRLGKADPPTAESSRLAPKINWL